MKDEDTKVIGVRHLGTFEEEPPTAGPASTFSVEKAGRSIEIEPFTGYYMPRCHTACVFLQKITYCGFYQPGIQLAAKSGVADARLECDMNKERRTPPTAAASQVQSFFLGSSIHRVSASIREVCRKTFFDQTGLTFRTPALLLSVFQDR